MLARPVSPIEGIAYPPEFMAAAKRMSEVDSLRTTFAVARQWLIIAAAFAAAIYSGNPLVYAIAFVAIASRQQALAALMHEATHRRLFGNAELNDFVGNLFCALPIGLSLARYADEHLSHHRAPNTNEDPYWLIFQANPRAWNWPKSRRGAVGLLLRDVLGLNTLSSGREIAAWTPWSNHFSSRPHPVPLPLTERIQLYVRYTTAAVLITLTHAWAYFLLLWLLPALTLSPLFVRIPAISEHFALKAENGTEATRDVDAHWLERLTICSFNINYHLVHHIFPYVTYSNLPKMHALLSQNAEFRRLGALSRTYLGRNGVLRGELISPTTV